MIIVGDALELPLRNESVQCVITSPPYWGLRKYDGDQSFIWDADVTCSHMWRAERPSSMRQRNGASGGLHAGRNTNKLAENIVCHPTQGSTCISCGAWLGGLGHEPTPTLYTQHLIQAFTEIHRVLRKDGTVWLNLGDGYAAGGHGGGGSFMAMRGGDKAQGAWSHRKDQTGWRNPPAGMKAKDLVGIPWMVAFALRDAGWYLRSDIIWAKPNPMPESVQDRPTRSHEYIFLLTKSPRYYYDANAVREPYAPSTLRDFGAFYESKGIKDYAAHGVQNPSSVKKRIKDKQAAYLKRQYTGFNERRENSPANNGGANCRSVWRITPKPFRGAHFATFPPELVERCMKAGSKVGDLVLDPFSGSGTTAAVAHTHSGDAVSPLMSRTRTANLRRRDSERSQRYDRTRTPRRAGR